MITVNFRTFAATIAFGAALTAVMPVRSGAQETPPPRATIPTPQPSPLAPPAPNVAPGYGASTLAPSSADLVGVTQQPFVGIALADAIGMALLKNPDLAVAASNTRVAGYRIASAKGAYDVKFLVEPSIKHDQEAPQNAFFSGPNFGPIVQNFQSVQAGVAGQLPSGTAYNVNLSQTRVDDNTFINAFNPYYLASINLSVTQPLLKGTYSDARRSLDLSVINADASSAQTLSTVSSTIASVQDTYWDLVAAWRNVAIQEDALRVAILQQQSNVRLARHGAAAPIDAVESSTQVAVYQDNVFAALQNVSSLQNTLKSEIVADPSDPMWRANLVPTSPALQLPTVPPLEQLLAGAMRSRPELREVADTKRQADVNLAYAKNQARPQVDLQMTYQGNGFAGNALPPFQFTPGVPVATPPPYLGGLYGQAYGNIGRFPTYQAGVVISQPIGDHTARADLATAHEQERIAGLQTASVQERVLFEVRNALQGYQSALSRLYAAHQAREAAAEVFASETRKFRNGASTTFLVSQRQVELVQDEGRELQAQTDLNKAIVELQRVDGSILTVNNVRFETLGTGIAPNVYGTVQP